MAMEKRIILIILCVTLTVLFMAIVIIGILLAAGVQAISENTRLSSATYVLSDKSKNLTETIALEYAEKTLWQSGYDTDRWHPVLYKIANQDHYLLQSVDDMSSGRIEYKLEGTNTVRAVFMEITEDHIVCEVVIFK